jgi:hypothetical protein
MLRRLLTGAATLAAFALAGPVCGAAASTPSPDPPVTDFKLPASNGYEITGSASIEGKSGTLYLEAVKPREEAIYIVKGEVDAQRIAFDLGSLGAVDLMINRVPGTYRIATGCGQGKPASVPRVELVGSFEFHGEEGFAEAAATAVEGLSVPAVDLRCSESSGGIFGEGLPGTALEIRHGRGPSLRVEQNHPGGAVTYESVLEERLEGGVRVTREVRGRVKASDFSFDPKLSEGRFAPAGGAVSGALTYTATKLPGAGRSGRGKIGGNLVIDFPGHPEVAIGDPGSTATMYHYEASSVGG